VLRRGGVDGEKNQYIGKASGKGQSADPRIGANGGNSLKKGTREPQFTKKKREERGWKKSSLRVQLSA